MKEKSKKKFARVEIVTNCEIPGSELRLLSFFEPTIALTSKPGQFVELGIPGCALPKPFSIMNTQKFGIVEILYQVVGVGTETLSNMVEGEEITVLGPLGNGFTIDDESDSCYLIGGGTGIAPILYFANYYDDKIQTNIFLGARTKNLLPDLSLLPKNTNVSTDDGSLGFKGNIVELMTQNLIPPAPIYSCGPTPMLRSIWEMSKDWKNKIEFSLETYMGCGVGACLGCQIQTKSGQKHVCIDGPVFDATEVSDVL